MRVGAARLAVYVPRLLLGGRPPVAQHWATEGSLLFCDVSGFTRLSERLARQGKSGAEELVTTLSRTYTALLSATEDGGDLLKFSGDALVVFYEGEDHAARAVHAAQGMRRALARVGSIRTSQGPVRLRMSTGVHSGEFRFFLCGDDHLELLAAGPGVSRTVEMEGAADAGEVLLSPGTVSALDPAALGPVKAGGRLLRRHRPLPPLGPPVHPDAPDVLASRFVPALLRERLGIAGAENEHRQVTVAFLQFRGTDEVLAAHGADDLFARLQGLTLAVQEATARYEVCIVATDIDADGGKFMLAAGAPCASEDDEGRMVRTCLDILAADLRLPVRIGVNRGHLFGGDVGAPFRRTYSTMGDATNLAARIMGKAPVGELLVHRAVLEHTADPFACRPVAPFTVKGKTGYVDACVVTGLADDAAPDDVGAAVTPPVPLVGRTAELAALAAARRRADEGLGVVVELVGEPGVGTTRVLRELERLAGDRRHLAISCDPYARATAFAAARTLFRTALGIPRAASRTEAGRIATDAIEALVPELRPLAALLAPVLHADLPPTSAVTELADRFRLARTHAVATQLLAAALPEAVVVIDDATWMDEASARLLAEVFRRTRDRRWVVAVARQDEERGLHAGLGYRAEVVHVGPLPPEDARTLVRAASQDQPLPPRTVAAIVDRGAGNPRFLLELVASADPDHGGALPSSVEAIVTSRMDRLAIADRGVLRDLAVLGTSVPAPAIDGVLGPDGVVSSDRSLWGRLGAFVTVAGDQVRFRSALHRDAAYEGLTFARRRELHERAARWLEVTAPDDPATAPALSWHHHQAQAWDRSWRSALRAGDQARSGFAHAEAARCYRRALVASRRLSGIADAELRRVAELLGDEEELAGNFEAARAAYRQARRHAAGDELACARLLHKTGVTEERVGRYPQSLRWYGRGLTAAERVPSADRRAALRADIAVAYAGVRFRQGRLDECAAWCRRALDEASGPADVETLAHAYDLLEAAYGMLGDRRAEEVRGRALPLYEQAGDLLGQGNVLNNLGITAYYGGRWDEALDLYARSRDAFGRVGDDVAAATAANNIAEILSDQGRLEPAAELFREALAIWRAVDYPIGVALAISNLGRLALRAGDPATARCEFDEAVRRFTAIGSGAFVLETRARRAEAYLALGRCRDAAKEAAAVLVGAERDGAGVLSAAVTRVHGEAAIACGDRARGLANLRTAVAKARELGAEHEVALGLEALARHDPERRAERRAEATRILDRLGVGASREDVVAAPAQAVVTPAPEDVQTPPAAGTVAPRAVAGAPS
jgi:class 3 adenylate cyclase/tetratricopeptide (TPR) repeat protein